MKLFTIVRNIVAAAALTSAASLQQVTNFGSNPTSINFYIYVPDKLATNPAIIVAVRIMSYMIVIVK
jgi:acetylxylan esterase